MTTKSKSADAIARDHTEEALKIIRDVMIDPLNETRDRLRAAETLLDRGHGKAVSAVISIPAGKRLAAQMAEYDDEALLMVIRETPLPRLGAPAVEEVEPVIEAEFEPVVEDGIDPLLL